MSAIHQTPQWRKLAKARLAIARERNEPCARCGLAIDYTLSGMHRWGPQVDHLYAAAVHPHLALDARYLSVSHRTCNQRHGAALGGRVVAARKRARQQGQPGASRRW